MEALAVLLDSYLAFKPEPELKKKRRIKNLRGPSRSPRLCQHGYRGSSSLFFLVCRLQLTQREEWPSSLLGCNPMTLSLLLVF